MNTKVECNQVLVVAACGPWRQILYLGVTGGELTQLICLTTLLQLIASDVWMTVSDELEKELEKAFVA